MNVHVVTDWHHDDSEVFGVYLSEAQANRVYEERIKHLRESGARDVGYSCSIDTYRVSTEGNSPTSMKDKNVAEQVSLLCGDVKYEARMLFTATESDCSEKSYRLQAICDLLGQIKALFPDESPQPPVPPVARPDFIPNTP